MGCLRFVWSDLRERSDLLWRLLRALGPAIARSASKMFARARARAESAGPFLGFCWGRYFLLPAAIAAAAATHCYIGRDADEPVERRPAVALETPEHREQQRQPVQHAHQRPNRIVITKTRAAKL